MKDEYDVAIVGAGPGGAYAAGELAKKGIDVLCIDKREEIGSPVRCGEGLAKVHFQAFGIPEKGGHIAQNIYGLSIYSPDGSNTKVKDKENPKLAGYVLERKIFDKYLAIRAAREGADLYAKTRCTGVLKGKNGVEGIKCERFGEEFFIKAKLTIAADGIDSKVARWAGLNTTETLGRMDSGFQYEMAGIDIDDHEVLEFHTGKNICPHGYIWIFPKGKDIANVGIGVSSADSKTAKYYLDKWIKDKGYGDASIVEVNAGAISIGGVCKEFTMDGLAVIGDAARQISPTHGGGIAYAMDAGGMIAEVGANAIQKEDTSKKVLKEYQIIWEKKYAKMFKWHSKLQKMYVGMSDEDLKKIVTTFDGETLFKLIQGGPAAAKALIKKSPQLGKLVLKLIT
ncbi:NAD(P)/FAD-dependent oxidoreductase [Candidatus Undinarchaeota archaeon]